MGNLQKTKKTIPWRKKYVVNIVDDETHYNVKAYRFTLLGFILGAVGTVVAIYILFFCLFSFSPLRFSIPGYPDTYTRKDANMNAIKIDSLERIITRWELYAGNLSRVMAGQECLRLDSLIIRNSTDYLKGRSEAEILRQDSLLREKVMKEEKFSLSSSKSKTLPLEGMVFFTPLKGVVSQGYDIASHPAIDVIAPAKSVISSVLDGTVIYSGWNEDSGYTIQVQHSGDLITIYKHCQKVLKNTGDKVLSGTPIALVGNTGKLSNGYHLHFEMWYKGETVDPRQYIKF